MEPEGARHDRDDGGIDSLDYSPHQHRHSENLSVPLDERCDSSGSHG
jgi:hypothetical protein